MAPTSKRGCRDHVTMWDYKDYVGSFHKLEYALL